MGGWIVAGVVAVVTAVITGLVLWIHSRSGSDASTSEVKRGENAADAERLHERAGEATTQNELIAESKQPWPKG